MKQNLLIAIIVSLFSTWAFAQQGDELKLLSSSNSIGNSKTGNVMFYRPVYEHKGSTLSADSGYVHSDKIGRDFFEAYGNVIITQPSGTQIFADKLHYEASTQLATLTQSVRMVDGQALLTTNYLTYDLRNSHGTYKGGGRIVSKGDTITSNTAYYYEKSGDTYFKNKVVVRSPSVKIFTDTMQYNSFSKDTYFFGATNMKGNKGENLYTQKGVYNTGSGQARFTKNNIYTENSKILKGDTLYYDRTAGIGKAIKNVIFIDTADKFYTYGGYGLYRQADQSILMTDKPLVVSVVKNDSTSNGSSLPSPNAANTTNTVNPANTANTANSIKKENSKAVLSKKEKQKEGNTKPTSVAKEGLTTLPTDSGATKMAPSVDSLFLTADTLFSRVIPLKEYQAKQFNLDREGGKIEDANDIDYGDEEDTSSLATDSLLVDSLALDTTKLSNKLSALKDTTALKEKNNAIAELKKAPTKAAAAKLQTPINKPKSTVTAIKPKSAPTVINQSKVQLDKNFRADSVLRKKTIFPKGTEVDSILTKAQQSVAQVDSVKQTSLDTGSTRIVNAYHHVRLFKSDFQAVADSVYYGMVDSMFRFMGKPMIWAESSQISADTIYLQVKNQKLENALLLQNAFMVSSVLDSIKYNQLKGRKITAFFTNNKLDRLFVDGNAESLYFIVNDKQNIITELFHDRSARIKILMKNSRIKNYVSIQKVESKIYPFSKVTSENEFLPGFIWKPQDRPKSKLDLLNRTREVTTDIKIDAKPEKAILKEDPPATKKK